MLYRILAMLTITSAKIFLFPENATIPLGESGIFECISMGEIVWRVNGTQTIDTGRLTQANKEELAREYNISISTQSDGGNMSSEVMILGNKENNLTIVECAMASAFLEDINFDENQVAFLRIFGPPDPVDDIDIIKLENQIYLTWSPPFSPYSIPVNYCVVIEDINNETILLSTIINSTSLLHTFSEDFCSVLKIRIRAFNRAGNSTLAEQTYSLLTKPKTDDTIASSLRHNLRLSDNQWTCVIEFEGVTGCPFYPVTHYQVLLEDLEGVTVLGPSTEPVFSINSSYLRENTAYNYTAKAINNVNVSSVIGTQEFTTADIQSSVAFLTSDSVLVQCCFIPGSQSRGCHVKLVYIDFMEDYNIRRVNHVAQENFVIGANETVQDILVFDWEKNGSIGSIAISVSIHPGTTSETDDHEVTTSTQETESSDMFVIIVIPAVVGALVLLLGVLLALSCAILLHNIHVGKKRQQERESQQHDLECDPSPYEVCALRVTTSLEHVPSINEPLYAEVSNSGGNSTYSHLSHLTSRSNNETQHHEKDTYNRLSYFTGSSQVHTKTSADSHYSQFGRVSAIWSYP